MGQRTRTGHPLLLHIILLTGQSYGKVATFDGFSKQGRCSIGAHPQLAVVQVPLLLQHVSVKRGGRYRGAPDGIDRLPQSVLVFKAKVITQRFTCVVIVEYVELVQDRYDAIHEVVDADW